MENWNHAKEIFYSALHKLPAEREIFLAEVCGDDSQLLSDVKMLIDSYKSEFLEQPILDFHTDSLTEISTDSQFQTGDIINHYIILRMLGRGGMGEVYLARDKKLDRLVAIKILHQGAGEKAEKRLLREARAVAKLNHSNICSIYEVSETDKFPFIVMQFVKGETLDILIKSNSISVNFSIEITRQIAEALNEAHTHNIIHRDIKPSNIIIDSKKQVKVLDFSLAKKALVETGAETESILSELGVVAGTIAYMSPEQARGQELDVRSDIWSLGVVLYEMLTGNLPFAGDSKSDIIASILTKDPPKLIETHADFPTEFDEIISKSLQKNRDLRYASIKEFSDALSKLNIVNQEFNQINPVGRNEAFPLKTAQANLVSNDSAEHSTFSELNKITDETISNDSEPKSKFSLKWLVLAVLGISILLGGAYWRFYAKSAPKFETFTADSRGRLQISTLFNTKKKPNGAITDVSFSPDGKLILFLLTGEEISDIYIKQTDSNEPIKITDGKWTNQTPVWSPDGQRIAFVSEREGKLGIWTVSYLGGTPILQTPLEQSRLIYQLRKWSNDEKRIFFENNQKLKTIDLASGQISDLKLPELEIYGSFSISSDEKAISFVAIENEREKVWVQSLETGEAKSVTNIEKSTWSPVFFPEKKRIAYSSNQNGNFQIYVTDLVEGSEPTQITFGDSNANIPTISPDGKKLVYVSELDEANIFSFNLNEKKETQQTSNTKLQLAPNISPKNDKMIFQTTDYPSKVFASPLKIKNLTDKTEITTLNTYGGSAKWSPTGEQIAFLKFSGGVINLWKIDELNRKESQLSKDGVMTFKTNYAPFDLPQNSFDWSRDGEKIVSVLHKDNFYNLWTVNKDGSNYQIVTNNQNKNIRYFSPIWSSDGKDLAFLYQNRIDSKKSEYGVSILSKNEVKNIYQTDAQPKLLGWAKSNSEIILSVKRPNDIELVKISSDSTFQPKTLTTLKGANFERIVISPDSNNVAFNSRRNNVDNIFVYTLGGKESQLTSNNESTIYYLGLSWSPDGKNLFYSKQSGGMQISLISDNP